MLKYVLGYAIAFAVFAVIYSLVKTANSDAGATIDFGLVATLFVTGGIGGVIAARNSKK